MRRTWTSCALVVLALACDKGDTNVTCPAGAAYCSGSCSSLATDVSNCGACGHACALHQDCVDGACTLRCQADLALCGSFCANLATDEQNCGACGHACATGLSCVGGFCGGASSGGGCSVGLSFCGGTCVNTATDPANCGTCGNVCPSGMCASSACLPVCAQTLCGTACVNLQTDRANCGACGHACLNGEICSDGGCVCAPGSAVCAGSVACVDLAWDAEHCGTCDVPCPAGETCVSGTCAPDASAFRTLGGDVGHSGLNPGESGVPPLTLAWTAPGSGGKGTPVIEGGRVFAIGGTRLHAHQATTGAELWSYNFGAVFGIGWPAVSDGHVYVATSNHSTDTWLRSFERATGAVEFKVGFASQWEQYWSPIVVDGVVYTNGGYYGGLYGFDATQDGQQLLFTSLEQYDEWSPAYFGTTVYTFVKGNVRAHDASSGATISTLDVGWTWLGYALRTAPVFGERYGYVISPPNLVAFDPIGPTTTALRQVWTINGAYSAYPAVASGTVYAISNGNLVALDALTGARKWLFTGDDHLAYPPVIAGGHVYVSSASNVYAVSAATHQQVWTAPVGGRLAVGAGMLVVSRESDGALFGFRLTR